MTKSWQYLQLAVILALGGTFATATSVLAQSITVDGTLSPAQTLTGPNYTIPQSVGQTVGNNLFQSFGRFNLNMGEIANFESGGNIRNILSRVTGGSASMIDGLISTNSANVNLFFINPSGIIFGPNASLNVGGSFVASTANALQFGNVGFFSATDKNIPSPLLTINPSALLFNQINQNAAIQNNSVANAGLNLSSEFTITGLRVPDGKSLMLVGGDIKMDGGGLYAFGGRVELGGLAGQGTVGMNGDGNNLSLSFPNSVERGDVFLSNGAIVGVIASNGGSIALNAGNLEMTGSSYLIAGIESGLGSDNSKAGNIDVNATKVINLKNGSGIGNQVLRRANGQGGDVIISASALRLESGAQVGAATFGLGKGGNLTINASDVQVIGRTADDQFSSALTAGAERNSTGDAGDLTIKTNTLLIKDGAHVSSGTFGSGKGGNLSVDAQDVQLIGTSADGRISSTLNTDVQPKSTGNAGDLTIKTNTLLIKDGAQVASGTFGLGKGGNLIINAQNVQVIGESFNGQAGSGLTVASEPNSTGDAGDLTIKTNTLLVRDGAFVGATTFGKGEGGDLTVDAQDVQLIGTSADGQFRSLLDASTQPNSTGNGGDLAIKTNTLLVRDGAGVSVQGTGTGIAGNMTLNARSIYLDNNALLTANTQSAKVDPNRQQATINIKSQFLTMSRNSNIFTNATGENVIGGNINIGTDFLIAFENSDTSANSANFRGGNVRINAQGIFGTEFRLARTPKSDITATGVSPEYSGTVEINTLDVEQNLGLVELPTGLLDTPRLVASNCNAFIGKGGSEFTVTGRGGLPDSPDDFLSSDVVWSDTRLTALPVSPSPRVTPSVRKSSSGVAIVPATGWVFDKKKGEVTLIASNATSSGLGSNQVKCVVP